MCVALIWVASPNFELCNRLGFLETTKFANLSKSRSLLRASKIKNLGKNHRCKSCYMNADFKGFSGLNYAKKPDLVSRVVANPSGELVVSSEQLVYDVVLKQAALVKEQMRNKEDVEVKPDTVLHGTLSLLSEAYDRRGDVCAEYAKTFYLGFFDLHAFGNWWRGFQLQQFDKCIHKPRRYQSGDTLSRVEILCQCFTRLRCIRMLNRIAAATNTFIPVAVFLSDMLDIKELRRPPTGSVGKSVDLHVVLKKLQVYKLSRWKRLFILAVGSC